MSTVKKEIVALTSLEKELRVAEEALFKAGDRMLEAAWDHGEVLNRIKPYIKYGQWTIWMEEHSRVKERQCRKHTLLASSIARTALKGRSSVDEALGYLPSPPPEIEHQPVNPLEPPVAPLEPARRRPLGYRQRPELLEELHERPLREPPVKKEHGAPLTEEQRDKVRSELGIAQEDKTFKDYTDAWDYLKRLIRQKCHPDKGGDAETFNKVQEAIIIIEEQVI